MAEAQAAETEQPAAPNPDVDAGNYEVIRRRLIEQARDLQQRTESLNQERQEVFGGQELAVLGQSRVRTENNCVPQDIIMVGGHLLVGFRVRVELKKEVPVEDIFGLYDFVENEDGMEVAEVSLEGTFLADPGFQKDFNELFRFYRGSRLQQLRKTETHLFAVFRFGDSPRDLKTFWWSFEPDGSLRYVDSRGQRDNKKPRQHDFAWRSVTRDDHVDGKYPHVSILDEVFVEAVGGDLTIKVEDNTQDGEGIYREPVDEPLQTLDDAKYDYARVGSLIVMRILPYNEQKWRYFVFSTRTKTVIRVDAIERACIQLPEDHGLVFPGGYVLQTGDSKVFLKDAAQLSFESVIKSPNGEDVLYVFHDESSGAYVLLSYNLIRKETASPIRCHGYSIFDNGLMAIFKAESDEPTRVHPLQNWQTPYTSVEFAASAPTDGSFLSKLGNAELVRGISDSLSIARMVQNSEPSRAVFEDLVGACRRTLDTYYWLGNEAAGDLGSVLGEILKTSELIIDEFEKVQALRSQARKTVEGLTAGQAELLQEIRTNDLGSVDAYMRSLTGLRQQRGRIITAREVRYVDLEALEALEAEAIEAFDELSQRTVKYLLGDDALAPLTRELDELLERVPDIDKTASLKPLRERLEETAKGLEVLSEVVAGLEVDDPTARTAILEDISEVFAQANRVRATFEARRKQIATQEGKAEFGAQFTLFGQSVASALNVSDTPEKCDEQLSKLLLQLEEIEARFGEFDEYLADLAAKRDEVVQGFEARKQVLLEERQRRARNLLTAADRILEGVKRRARQFESAEQLNTFYASDPMMLKINQLAEQLVDLGESVKADELLSRVKSSRSDALRALRDRLELFEGGDNLVKFGRHRFSVNTQEIQLTIVPHDDGMAVHLTGTDFYEPLDDAEFEATRPFWSQAIVSETDTVYRAEYLAAQILFAAENGTGDTTIEELMQLQVDPDALATMCRKIASERYDEGYERGVHDSDGARILEKLLALRSTAGLLRYPARERALACLFWSEWESDHKARLHRRAVSLARLRTAFPLGSPRTSLEKDLQHVMQGFFEAEDFEVTENEARIAAEYLAQELRQEQPRFTTAGRASRLKDQFREYTDLHGQRSDFEEDLRSLPLLGERFELARVWVDAFVAERGEPADTDWSDEVAALLVTDTALEREVSSALTSVQVDGLLGSHPLVKDGKLELRLEEFMFRLRHFAEERVPGYRNYRRLRSELVERETERLRIDEFKPKVMSAFVRNRLINESYLPLIGDNLAKQMGASGGDKRTDLMGMLLLISPPGYGKTTLMEYVASRLGLVFMKVNGPALGHSVTSLDPAEAPSATARQEVEKTNLAFEMGNNVMLYLDDIQHCNPEFLQKFISLCDAQRRIEGVWKGKTRTYDLRGKKFCVIMAGNPYTESGDKFQIPDMLANRADTYNLGDVLSGKDEIFALSYVENSLTSNPVLAPLATREMSDVYKIIRMAQGEEIPTTELKHGYSAVELREITEVFKKLFRVQEVVLEVNKQYIASAAQNDDYRTEPPFKLQGSYRNMNKMAEKVVGAMNDKELTALIDDHYIGEAQTLTTGAEQNLLKLKELRGVLTPQDEERWTNIKRDFVRIRRMGGADDDPVARLTGTLGGLGANLEAIRDAVVAAASHVSDDEASDPVWLNPVLEKLEGFGQAVKTAQKQQGADAPAWLPQVLEQLRGLEKALAGSSSPGSGAKGDSGSGTEQLTEAVLNRLDALSQTLAQAGQQVAESQRSESSDWIQPLMGKLDELASALTKAAPAQPPAAPKLPAWPDAQPVVPDSLRPSRPPAPMSSVTQSNPPAVATANLSEAVAELQRSLNSTMSRSLTEALEKRDAQMIEALEKLARAFVNAQRRMTQQAKAVSAPLSGSGEAREAEVLPALPRRSAEDEMVTLQETIGKQAAAFERTLLPLVNASARNMDEATAVNARLVELLDVLKGYMRHISRLRGNT